MLTIKKAMSLIALVALVLLISDCKKKEAETEAAFITEKIYSSGSEYRVSGLEDLFYFSSRQALDACELDCGAQEKALSVAMQDVSAMQALLTEKIGGIQPPPPPRPCGSGSCIWDLLAIRRYFVDLKKFGDLPLVVVQNLNGETISSSEQAEVIRSPEGGQFALVTLPEFKVQDDAVNVVVKVGEKVAEIRVTVQ